MDKEIKPEDFEKEIVKDLTLVSEVLNLIKKLDLAVEVGFGDISYEGAEHRWKVFRTLKDGQLLRRRNQSIKIISYLLLRDQESKSFLVKFKEG